MISRFELTRIGKTRNVTFRDVAHVILVREEQIYSTGSPIHPTGQYVQKTAESSFFRYLLTGVDDGTVISREIDTDARSRRLAQVDAIDDLIRKTQESLAVLTDAPQEIQQQIQRINATLLNMTQTMTVDQQHLQEQQRQRQELWNRVQRRTARSEVWPDCRTDSAYWISIINQTCNVLPHWLRRQT